MAATRERKGPAQQTRPKKNRSARRTSGGGSKAPAEQDQEGLSGHGTAALVAAAAGIGALAGLAAMRKRRASQDSKTEDEQGSAEAEDDEQDEQDEQAEDDQPQAEADSGTFRSMAINVLEAALDGLKDVGETSETSDGADEDEDDERDSEDDGDEGEEPPEDDEPEDPEASAEPEDEEDEPSEEDEEDEPEARAEPETEDDEEADDEEEEDDDRREAVSRNGHHDENETPTYELIERARQQFAELVGREPEAVSRCERDNGGWQVGLEVVELERIPHSTDVLASYDVSLDEKGRLLEYSRARRYVRNRAEDMGG